MLGNFLLPGAALAAVLAITLAVVLASLSQGRQRDAGYRAYCAAHGYQYTALRPGAERQYADTIDFFNHGAYRFWRCEISGSVNGMPFVAFEYAYRNWGRRAPRTVLAIMKWEQRTGQPPEFYILPAKVLYGKASSRMALLPRVEFPDDPLFTETYALLCDDPDAIREFMTPEIRARLQTLLGRDPAQYVLSRAKTMFWWELGSLPPPDQLDAFIAARDRLRAVLLPS